MSAAAKKDEPKGGAKEGAKGATPQAAEGTKPAPHGEQAEHGATAGGSSALANRLKEGFQQLSLGLKEARDGSSEVAKGVFSKDSETRSAAWVFWGSLFGLLSLIAGGAHHLWKVSAQRKAERIAMEHAAGEAHANGAKGSTGGHGSADAHGGASGHGSESSHGKKADSLNLVLGMFSIDLKRPEGVPRDRALLGIAEIEIVVICSSPEVREYIEQHIVQARNQITNVLTEITREELLSKEGKKSIRKHVMERLNGWLPKGKVEEVYFSRLLMT